MQKSSENLEVPQCKHFVRRKRRFCRMTVRPGRLYCGEHEPEPTTDSGEPDTRIPCPLDQKHTCYASKLEKHLQICNARQTDIPAYIVHNVNSAPEDNEAERKPLSEVSKVELYAVIDKVNRLYDEIISTSIPTQPPAPIHPVVTQEFNEPDRGDNSRRHLHQVSALMKVMQDEGLVQDNHCYVELGAGKGHLSYYICIAWCLQNSSRTVLIDRAALRHKRDNKLKETREEGRVARIRADLAHLSLGDVEVVKGCSGVVGFAKHLCGVASDLAIRCMTESRMLDRTKGVVLATCCHHRCVFSTYVGRTYLLDIGITPSELNIMLGIVSWYTCGDGLSRDQRTRQANAHPNHNLQTSNNKDNHEINEMDKNKSDLEMKQKNNAEKQSKDNENNSLKSDFKNGDFSQNENSFLIMTREAKEEVGRRAKVLIDWGRVEYLKSCGFDSRLCHFVPTSISLENVCIVAKKVVTSVNPL